MTGAAYEAAGVTLYQGDCLELLPSLSADVILTDPPYNAGKNYGATTNDRMPWEDWCRWWDRCLEAMAGSAPDIFAFMSQTAWRRYVRLGRHEPDWTLVWQKPLALACCAFPFMPHWERIAYWGLTRKKDGAFWGSDVLSCNVTPNHGHPTEKPLALMEQLILRFDPAAVILDPFAGSGTTLVAARNLGRQAIGIEINPQYVQVAADRLRYGVRGLMALERGQVPLPLEAE